MLTINFNLYSSSAATSFLDKAALDVLMKDCSIDADRYNAIVRGAVSDQPKTGPDAPLQVLLAAVWNVEFMLRGLANSAVIESGKGKAFRSQIKAALEAVLLLDKNPSWAKAMAATEKPPQNNKIIHSRDTYQIAITATDWSTPAWNPRMLRAFENTLTVGLGSPRTMVFLRMLAAVSYEGMKLTAPHTELEDGVRACGVAAVALELAMLAFANPFALATSDHAAFWADIQARIREVLEKLDEPLVAQQLESCTPEGQAEKAARESSATAPSYPARTVVPDNRNRASLGLGGGITAAPPARSAYAAPYSTGGMFANASSSPR